MFESSSTMRINNLMEKALDVESLRRKVIANNVANVDVPHFKRSEVNFESELRRVITEQRNPDNRLPAILTNERHIPFYIPREIESVKPRINLDYNTTARNDGNNVDIEKEIVDSAKNQLRYNAYITMLNNSYRNLKNVMRPA
ncbi:MAG: flagellar basal body rod protein FlgB [Spirochaetes bacterium]|nr:flagellar basal body rod protein FlgB [Spirochaetota bacterium]